LLVEATLTSFEEMMTTFIFFVKVHMYQWSLFYYLNCVGSWS